MDGAQSGTQPRIDSRIWTIFIKGFSIWDKVLKKSCTRNLSPTAPNQAASQPQPTVAASQRTLSQCCRNKGGKSLPPTSFVYALSSRRRRRGLLRTPLGRVLLRPKSKNQPASPYRTRLSAARRSRSTKAVPSQVPSLVSLRRRMHRRASRYNPRRWREFQTSHRLRSDPDKMLLVPSTVRHCQTRNRRQAVHIWVRASVALSRSSTTPLTKLLAVRSHARAPMATAWRSIASAWSTASNAIVVASV